MFFSHGSSRFVNRFQNKKKNFHRQDLEKGLNPKTIWNAIETVERMVDHRASRLNQIKGHCERVTYAFTYLT